MNERDHLDKLIKKQFQQDTEHATANLPSSHSVELRSQVVMQLKSQEDRHHKSLRSIHNTYRFIRWVPIALFLLSLAVLISLQGIDLSIIKILALGSLVVVWLLDRLE